MKEETSIYVFTHVFEGFLTVVARMNEFVSMITFSNPLVGIRVGNLG